MIEHWIFLTRNERIQPTLVLHMPVSTFKRNTSHGTSTQVQKTKNNNHHSQCSLFWAPRSLIPKTEHSLQIVIYWNDFIDIRPWFLHLASDAIFRRKSAVLISETSRAVRQSFCPTITQYSKIQGYKFSFAKIKTQPKVTPLNSLYPVGSSESYFFPPTHFHTPNPTPHPPSSSWLFFRASFGREERNGGSGWKLRWREAEKNYIYRRKIKNEGWKESKWQPYWGLLCQRQH